MLFAMLFQSFHATEHLVEQFSNPHCDHHYNIGKTEVGHAHNDTETCFSCEFTFAHYTPAMAFRLNVWAEAPSARVDFIVPESSPAAFGGALLTLRGPPALL